MQFIVKHNWLRSQASMQNKSVKRIDIGLVCTDFLSQFQVQLSCVYRIYICVYYIRVHLQAYNKDIFIERTVLSVKAIWKHPKEIIENLRLNFMLFILKNSLIGEYNLDILDSSLNTTIPVQIPIIADQCKPIIIYYSSHKVEVRC